MPLLDAYRERDSVRVNGSKYHIRVKVGRVIQTVKVRDGHLDHLHNTICCTRRLSFLGQSLDEQVMETLNRAVKKEELEESKEEKVRREVEKGARTVKRAHEVEL